jgi:hypothetical protein
MEESHYLRELHGLDPDDLDAVERLLKRLKDDARHLPRMSVRLWAEGEPDEQRKAAEIVFQLEELVIEATLSEQETLESDRKLQLLGLAVEEQLDVRSGLVSVLSQLLEDKTILHIPEPASDLDEEEEPEERRVCDQAYLLLRRLLNTEEDEGEHALSSSDFLELEERERDGEIRKAISSKTWTIWFEEDE